MEPLNYLLEMDLRQNLMRNGFQRGSLSLHFDQRSALQSIGDHMHDMEDGYFARHQDEANSVLIEDENSCGNVDCEECSVVVLPSDPIEMEQRYEDFASLYGTRGPESKRIIAEIEALVLDFIGMSSISPFLHCLHRILLNNDLD